MASQSPIFSSLIPINKKSPVFSPQPINFFTFKNSKIQSSIKEPSQNSQENEPEQESQTPEQDRIKLAFSKAQSYKNSAQSNPIAEKSVQKPVQESFSDRIIKGSVSDEVNKDDDGEKEVPLAVKIALEKAKEYKQNKGVVNISESSSSGSVEGKEISTGVKKPIKNDSKNKELTVSGIDFVGLNFSDKKIGRGLPAGLIPVPEPYFEGELPDVEILVGDKSKFGEASAASNPIPVEDDDVDLYKPKITTWGLFPRPNDISKAYGGGRTLRPGEALETAEERAAKQAKTRQLLSAYKKKIGINTDPKLRSECEKALKDGDSLMDLGQLKEALPLYEEVMEKLPFKSEIHGLAALQWSICLDSLTRPNEARMMYEKLQSHPSPKVSKRARQLAFSFQAMEMMKFTSSPFPVTGYQNFFDAFVKDRTNYALQDTESQDEAGFNQALPYVFFLVSPILMVLLIAAYRTH